MNMSPSLPEAVWIDQAVMELGRLLPSLTPEEITGIVKDHLWHEGCDLTPREAAEIYALEAPPQDPGAAASS